MDSTYQSLSHSRWDCKYHVVFVPKYCRQALYGEIRKQLGQIFHELAKQKERQILEGHLMPDHVHMRIAVPPKHAVVEEHFWAGGYAVSTVGVNEDEVRSYIRNQNDSNGSGRF